MFVKEETVMWPWLLIFMSAVSIGFGYVCTVILKHNTVECAGTRSCVTVMFCAHCIILFACLVSLAKLEIKYANGWWMFGFFLIFAIILVWGNITFFQA
jgi:hypothetical protein